MNASFKTKLIDFVRSVSEKSPMPLSGFQDLPERVLYSSGINFATCNGVIEKQGAPLTPHDLDEVIRFFDAKKLPFIWWTKDPFLETQGFQFGGVMTGISLNTAEINTLFPSPPANVELKMVRTEEDLHLFCQVIADCCAFPLELKEQYERVSKIAMDRKEQIHLLAYSNGIPVATASLAIASNSAKIHNCTTLPSYRNKGIGTFLCSTASVEAKKRNYSQVIAITMPKGMASGLFKKLGYQKISTLPFYVYGASPDEIEK